MPNENHAKVWVYGVCLARWAEETHALLVRRPDSDQDLVVGGVLLEGYTFETYITSAYRRVFEQPMGVYMTYGIAASQALECKVASPTVYLLCSTPKLEGKLRPDPVKRTARCNPPYASARWVPIREMVGAKYNTKQCSMLQYTILAMAAKCGEELVPETTSKKTQPVLTKLQARYLAHIRLHIKDHNRPPTYRELAQRFGCASANAAKDVVDALVKKEYLSIAPGVNRGIVLVD